MRERALLTVAVAAISCGSPPTSVTSTAAPASISSTSGAPTGAPSASPSAAPRASAAPVLYSTVAATTQPPGSILITMTKYQFTPATLVLPAGNIVLYLVNASDVEHDIVLRDLAPPFTLVLISGIVEPGRAVVATIDGLPAGVYRARCTVTGHADLGMVGEITVK